MSGGMKDEVECSSCGAVFKGRKRSEPTYYGGYAGGHDMDDYDDKDTVKAADGFTGIITEPKAFLVGEDGPEMVDIRPLKEQNKRKKPQRNTNKSTDDYGFRAYQDYDFMKEFNSFFKDY